MKANASEKRTKFFSSNFEKGLYGTYKQALHKHFGEGNIAKHLNLCSNEDAAEILIFHCLRTINPNEDSLFTRKVQRKFIAMRLAFDYMRHVELFPEQ